MVSIKGITVTEIWILLKRITSSEIKEIGLVVRV